ncbi:MAG TPA: Cof-type HAD-IIB family hydrolase [Candidatus Dormibacteraeota bacterium]|nr:Cof-type HAD-IIB family hydrolase [Candidatus Dormibacteraeota bacterium]
MSGVPAPSRAPRYRLLAVDLDGTLLSFDLHLDPRDVEALHRAMAAGLRVVACTGRPFPGALPWAQAIGLHDPLVCYQGAQVRALDGAVLLDHGVPHELAMEVVRFCRERDLHVQAYVEDRLIVERDRPEAQAYARHAGMEVHVVGDLDRAMGATTPKVVIVADPEVVERLLPEVRQRWAGRLVAATSLPTYLEVTSVAADKQQALRFLCDRFGIGPQETVAIGDGRNDETMIAWAGLGYAVEGAPPEVLAAADGRTVGRPGSGGIARLVERLLE